MLVYINTLVGFLYNGHFKKLLSDLGFHCLPLPISLKFKMYSTMNKSEDLLLRHCGHGIIYFCFEVMNNALSFLFKVLISSYL